MNPSSVNPYKIADLISRSQQGDLTADEQLQLDSWLASNKEHQLVWEEVNNPEIQQQAIRSMSQFDESAALERFLSNKPNIVHSMPARKTKVAWFRYAAAIILMIGAAVYGWLHYNTEPIITNHNKQLAVDIKPGQDGAVLTLADGSQLVIDSLQEGFIAEQNGSKILLEDGRMTYNVTEKPNADIVYNTMTTPKGRQFQFTLPDGTKVWLNAASSIRYPTAFNGKNRKVSVKGEAYFDVSKNANKPFIVEADDMTVEVLGTEFNINSYDNEAYSQTTLVNGLVKVVVSNADNLAAHSKLLYPGKQAIILREGNESDPIKISDATNIDQVIAWKDGIFNFDKVDLFNLMRQLERWYNIEVEYKGDVKNITFRGKVYRNVNLSDVLSVLKKMGVSFEQEGNKLIIKSTE